jgi:hypothetical protein
LGTNFVVCIIHKLFVVGHGHFDLSSLYGDIFDPFESFFKIMAPAIYFLKQIKTIVIEQKMADGR